ncbi:hypothetical protein IV203_011436 [Nitzschia inconspicua]|uniref:Uncharacterized protein n=1 Tax=Nitzschia inconspicua TaxID=303405 RepID=A0A9K3PL10_9STRA|nr:hypothetical protein IV203_011436 [Nitzschia inconspicua]
MWSFRRQSSSFSFLLFLLATASPFLAMKDHSVYAKNAHFTMEFIPTFKNGLPHKCNSKEVAIMEKFLGDLLTKETGMDEHSVEYLDQMYESDASHSPMKRHHFQKVRGFDFSMECPSTATECGMSDWCHILCFDESVKPGHDSLTTMATHLKDKLHSESKALEGPFQVKCLGHPEQLDFHLLVSISP